MGSKFFSVHIADPSDIQPLLRGERADLAAHVYSQPEPPLEALRPAFEVIERGLLCFVCGVGSHPEGHLYTRAVEHLLDRIGVARWGVEFYPDESVWAIWSLVFDPCEATWLNLPTPNTGLLTLVYRDARSCASYARSVRQLIQSGDYETRYISEGDLRTTLEALEEAADSGFGAFVMYQA